MNKMKSKIICISLMLIFMPIISITIANENILIQNEYHTQATNITISNPSPNNGSTGISFNPFINVTLNNSAGNNMTVEFWTNASGVWQLLGQNVTNETLTENCIHSKNATHWVGGLWQVAQTFTIGSNASENITYGLNYVKIKAYKEGLPETAWINITNTNETHTPQDTVYSTGTSNANDWPTITSDWIQINMSY